MTTRLQKGFHVPCRQVVLAVMYYLQAGLTFNAFIRNAYDALGAEKRLLAPFFDEVNKVKISSSTYWGNLFCTSLIFIALLCLSQ